LEQDISRLQREVSESFNSLLERTDAAGTISESDDLLARISAEVGAQIDQATAQGVRLGADIALLRDSVAELDSQRSQAEVLNTLVARAANFAPRVVLFVVKGGNAVAWAARGFEDGVGNNNVRGLSISLNSDTVLRAALNSLQTFYGSADQHEENQLIVGRLGTSSPMRQLAVPLRVRGKAAAVLYADSSDRGEDATNVEAIELLVSAAGLVVEVVSLRARIGQAAPAASKEAPAKRSAPPSEPAYTSAGAPSGELSSHTRMSSTPPSTEESPATAPEVEPPPPVVETTSRRDAVLDEEERQHSEARRFARLLVSEIKLYNEQRVADGRRNNDLYDRLRDDISRSREMYNKRVTPAVAAKIDYFHDELVKILAEGDIEKLGADYAGPAVRH
jgi:hypothetical protein